MDASGWLIYLDGIINFDTLLDLVGYFFVNEVSFSLSPEGLT